MEAKFVSYGDMHAGNKAINIFSNDQTTFKQQKGKNSK
jgi:hypothetical protein